MKAVVVGGSNGIGLAISEKLLGMGYHVNILDIVPPEAEIENISYFKLNMLDPDIELLQEQAADEEVKVLMVTAGIGRVSNFEYLHFAEIQKLLTIDLVSTIQIFRIFYDRIKAKDAFYSGVMGSIAGLVSSPMFSVYAAAKAGICRFVESVNIELEVDGCTNRILNVSPGSIKGTKFNGGSNDLSQTANLAAEIVNCILSSKELLIPQYEEIYRDVIERYQKDAHEYGVHSYEYKQQSGRALNERKVKIGYLSGTFDLFHVGHLNLLKRAKERCDYLIVGVHSSGAWKGKETFIPFKERKAVVSACKYVDKVVDSMPEDDIAVLTYGANVLFVGSDYKGSERFNRYEAFFADKDVEIVYFPYTQGTSSTQIRGALKK